MQMNNFKTYLFVQQSSLPPHAQLCLPHIKDPMQSMSKSQSPSPKLHGVSGSQHPSSSPLQKAKII